MDPVSVYLFGGTWLAFAVHRAAATSGLFGSAPRNTAAPGAVVAATAAPVEQESEEDLDFIDHEWDGLDTSIDTLPLGSEGHPVVVVQSGGILHTVASEGAYKMDDDSLSSNILRNDSEFSLGLNRNASFEDEVNTLGPMCAPGQILCRTGNYAVVVGSVAVFVAYVVWPRLPRIRLH